LEFLLLGLKAGCELRVTIFSVQENLETDSVVDVRIFDGPLDFDFLLMTLSPHSDSQILGVV